MKELDLLKKDWKKNENSFVPVSENEIYKMIHQRSSSIVKWIFLISVLEFLVLNGVGFLIPDEYSKDVYGIDKYINAIQILSYVVTLFFMFLFYKNYQNISATSNTKRLMETILKTRKTVQYYIWYNILYVAIIVSGISVFIVLKNHHFSNQNKLEMFGAFSLMLVFVLVLMGVVWLFYRFLYGILLRKLNKNYQELKKIDL
jgi:hypothetical protein